MLGNFDFLYNVLSDKIKKLLQLFLEQFSYFI